MNHKASGLATVAILFLVLSLFVVALRSYVRAGLIKGWGLDDTATVISMVWRGNNMGYLKTGTALTRCRGYTSCTSHSFSPASPMALVSI